MPRACSYGHQYLPFFGNLCFSCLWKISASIGLIIYFIKLDCTNIIKSTMSMSWLWPLVHLMHIQYKHFLVTLYLEFLVLLFFLSLQLSIMRQSLYGLCLGWWRHVKLTLVMNGVGDNCHFSRGKWALPTTASTMRHIQRISVLSLFFGTTSWRQMRNISPGKIKKAKAEYDEYVVTNSIMSYPK